MNLRRLETFYWAAKLGSFTAAAEKLNSTPSTVSMRIQELERELGVVLFDRTQRVARTTELGRDLVDYVQRVLRSAEEMRERVATTESTTGTLRIGVAEVISITWLPELISRLHARFPKVQIELEEALTRDLESKLYQNALDIILAPGEGSSAGCHAVPLGQVEFGWMASPALGVPRRGRMRPAELERWPIIALSEESYHDSLLEHWFQAGGARFARIGTCKSMGVAASLAMSGLGVTLLPVRCYQTALAKHRLVRVETVPAFQPIPFRAMYTRPSINHIAEKAAELAGETSDFEGTPAGARFSREPQTAAR